MDLSIVIPAFNESKKIARDVEAAAAFLLSHHLSGEIIVVDDGSEDDTAGVANRVHIPPAIERQVIRCEPHRGKGFAVRTGITRSRGDFVMYADSGLCVPYGNVLSGLDMLKSGTCDIAHGSRKLRQSKIVRPQSWYRRISSRLFRWLTILRVKIPAELTDTQCGFKIYRGEVARELYEECVTEGFTFELEIILRARRKGYRIAEFPVEWTCDRDSRLTAAQSPLDILFELKEIRRVVNK